MWRGVDFILYLQQREHELAGGERGRYLDVHSDVEKGVRGAVAPRL